MNTFYYLPHSTTIEGNQNTDARSTRQASGILMKVAITVSRSRWYSFLRRVFEYQNGSRSDITTNPFNSKLWLLLELIILLVQILVVTLTLALSKKENPVWPLRIWLGSYDIGNILSLPLLYWRYRYSSINPNIDLEQQQQQQQTREESRNLYLVNRSRTSLELFYAIWFVMGNIWVFDSRYGTFVHAPKLQSLCVALLTWNAVAYSFPFLLFLLLCCLVPCVSRILGYNMNKASDGPGASDDQIASLPHWKFKEAAAASKSMECCCICLSKYMEREEVRELPCLHTFHQTCVDQWLRIISCCPLCKQGIGRST